MKKNKLENIEQANSWKFETELLDESDKNMFRILKKLKHRAFKQHKAGILSSEDYRKKLRRIKQLEDWYFKKTFVFLAFSFWLLGLAFDGVVTYTVYRIKPDHFFRWELNVYAKEFLLTKDFSKLLPLVVQETIVGSFLALAYLVDRKFSNWLSEFILVLAIGTAIACGVLHFYGGWSWLR